MNEVQQVTSNGFRLTGESDLDLAFLSLRIALKAYFSTYSVSRNRFNPNDPELDELLEGNLKYCEACAETIVHFQHFFELIIKDILRSDHFLLAVRANKYPVILHKILHNQELTSEEEQRVQSVEFSEALDNICSLINSNQLQCCQDVQFIVDNKNTLKELNTLRNKVWHRGAFFLYYTKLDEFIGKFVLPVIETATQLPKYQDIGVLWKYKNTECAIDPIKAICNEYRSNLSVSIGKIALLKEIGRAAYNNPLSDKKKLEQRRDERIKNIEERIKEYENRSETIPKALLISKGMADMRYRMETQFDTPYVEKAKKIACHEAAENYSEIKPCPVCGVNSLVLNDISDSIQDSDTGEEVSYSWVDSAKCECCTFEIDSKLEIKDYNITIDNYWTVTQF